MFSGIEIIWDRQFGFLKETLVAPVSRFEIMAGRTLGGATVALFQGLIVFFLSMAFGFRPTSTAMLPMTFLFAALIALLFTALGTAIASLLEDMQGFQLIMNFLVMPTFFLSGSLFPLAGLPKALTIVARFNPLAYGVDALRGTLTGILHFGFPLDFVVLGSTVGVFLALGAYLFSKIEV